MANPTTNYGFVLPTPTDLVTDLPADFDVALQGVDTRLKALQPGTTLGDLAYSSATANTNTRLGIGSNGQVLTVASGVPSWAAASAGGGWQVVKASTTFTSVADTGTTFDNIFSSSYNFYMVQITTLGGGNAGTDDLQMQMIYSGTTETGAGYYGTTFGNIHSAASPTSTATSGATQFTMTPITGSAGNGDRSTGNINFYQVFGTSSAAAFQGQILQGSQYGNYVFAGQSSTTRTYTGFKLKMSAGNITGTLTVYGLV